MKIKIKLGQLASEQMKEVKAGGNDCWEYCGWNEELGRHCGCGCLGPSSTYWNGEFNFDKGLKTICPEN